MDQGGPILVQVLLLCLSLGKKYSINYKELKQRNLNIHDNKLC